jgi:hypothetical protein
MNKAIVQKQKYMGAFACFWALFIVLGLLQIDSHLARKKGFFLAVCV